MDIDTLAGWIRACLDGDEAGAYALPYPPRELTRVASDREVLAAITAIRPTSTGSTVTIRQGRAGTYRGGRIHDPRPGLLRAMATRYADRDGYREEWAYRHRADSPHDDHP